MKPNQAFLILLLPLSAGLEAKEANPAPAKVTEHSQEHNTPAAILATQVKEIVASNSMSRKSQAKLITNAVRLAITTATEGIKDPAERLRVALELATVAAQAAPHFAATITSAVSGIATIANIEGAVSQIQAAVSAGIAAADDAAGSGNQAGNSGRPRGKPEFDGPNKDETVVSRSQ